MLFVDVVPHRAVKHEVERLGNGDVSKKGTQTGHVTVHFPKDTDVKAVYRDVLRLVLA